MGIQVLSVAENKKGYWIVFTDDMELKEFKTRLTIYGQTGGPNYDFFNAIESFQDIPVEKKIGDFTDTGENVFSNSGNSTITGSFTVSATAAVGTARMRVSMRAQNNPSNCGSLSPTYAG